MPERQTINSICIMRMSAIGDAVLTIPLVQSLQYSFPQARIYWITSPIIYSLLKDLEGVEFIVADKPSSLKDYLALRRQLRKYRFDILLAIQVSLRINLIYPFIRAERKIGYDRKRARDGQWLFTNERIAHRICHTLESFLDFADFVGADTRHWPWGLPIDQATQTWAREQLAAGAGKHIVVVNPAASSVERTWPEESYVALIDELHAHGEVFVVLTGGPSPDELSLGQRISQACMQAPLNLVGKTKLLQLAAVLQQANCVVAPDTGPAHIASAVNTPVVGLYAVASPTLWGPYRSMHLSIDHHAEAIRTILNKDPDSVSPMTRVHDRRAMDLITVEEVLDKVRQALSVT
ncbi:MAG: glycosyltransferase family 9 protein [Gammaproteobacteria bacterium]|nr:glycosyltransferase family 9 protein [Gammaproteobacteria bacterium]